MGVTKENINGTGTDFLFDFVLKTLKTDFCSLFSGSNCPAEWDYCFLARIVDLKILKRLRCSRILTPSTNNN